MKKYFVLYLFMLLPTISIADVLGEFYYSTSTPAISSDNGTAWEPAIMLDICFKAKHTGANKSATCTDRYKAHNNSLIITGNDLGAIFTFNATNTSSFYEFAKLLTNGKIDRLSIIYSMLNTPYIGSGSSTGPEYDWFFRESDQADLIDFDGYNIESIDIIV